MTARAGFEVLRDARELHKVTFAIQMAPQRADIAEQARYRLASYVPPIANLQGTWITEADASGSPLSPRQGSPNT